MKPQAPCYSEIFPELKAADFRWPEWLPWLAGCLWFCPMYSRRPLAAVLCKSLHPSVSSEGNAFHYCSFLAQVPQDLPVHWHQISASSVLWNDNLAFCLKSPCSEDRGGTVQAQRRTLLSSCTITAIDSPQLSLEPGSTDSSLACWCSCLHRHVSFSWTCPCFHSTGCFHSRNRLIRRGRGSSVKREQNCQNKRRKGQKPPSNQRSWKHRSSLPPLITASPTSKYLRVRSGSLARVLQAVENVASWALRRLYVNTDAKAVQTSNSLTVGKYWKKFTWGINSLAFFFSFANKNPETVGWGDCGFTACFSAL